MWVSRDTGVYYYPPRGDAYSTMATILPSSCSCIAIHVHVEKKIIV